MNIHLKNIPAKFHTDPTWNNGASGFWRPSPEPEQEKDDFDPKMGTQSPHPSQQPPASNRKYWLPQWCCYHTAQMRK